MEALNDKLLEHSILEDPAQTLDFIKSVFQSPTDYSIIANGLDGTVVLWNEGARQLYGFTPEEVLGKLHGSVLLADQNTAACRWRELIQNALRDGKWEGDLRGRRRNGQEFNAHMVITPLLGASGNPRGILLISKDISVQTDLQAELQRSNDVLLQQIAERNSVEAALKLRTMELEQTNSQMSFSSQLAELLHACINMTEARQVVERKLPQFFQVESGTIYLHRESSGKVERFAGWNEDARGSTESFDPTDCWAIRLARPNVTRFGDTITRCAHTQGEPNRVSICVPLVGAHSLGLLNLSWLDGDAIAIGRDDVRLKFAMSLADMLAIALSNIRLREMLLEQSTRDPLTHLYNRRHMQDALNREIHRARRAGSSIGVILVDVDDFKEFNDSFGHPAGDELLRSFGNYLTSHARPEDIVARYGGEEFILVLPGAASETVLARALALQKEFRMFRSAIHGQIKPPSFSCGVAVFPEHGSNLEETIEQADRALYRAKELGKNRVVSACETEGACLTKVGVG